MIAELNPGLSLTWPSVAELAPLLEGWNCADIRRLVDDLLREILGHDPDTPTIVKPIFMTIYRSIAEQYKRCNQDLSRALAIETTTPSYIT